jgi:hypothetical protein
VTDKVQRLEHMYVTPEAIENAREELRRVAYLVQIGMEDQMTPCQTIVFELLQKSEIYID